MNNIFYQMPILISIYNSVNVKTEFSEAPIRQDRPRKHPVRVGMKNLYIQIFIPSN